MFCTGPVLVDFRHFQSSAVVFEHMAVDFGIWRVDRESAMFHFLEDLHDWNRVA